MFFSDGRAHFFRPLTGKYRARVLACLGGLHRHLYGAVADASRALGREQLLAIFEDAIARSPVLDDPGQDLFALPSKGQREQAIWIMNQLIEHGWIERQLDEATLQSSFAFSRHGRQFTQPMVDAGGGRFRTRHRNTRNTRNALQSFIDTGEVYDLLDAFEYSERIISDFSDVIGELDERKRDLVREVESMQLVQHASDAFFDFMEKRFMPDLAIRLSADSVEKYRDEISGLVHRARRQHREFKVHAEQELRRLAPELVRDPGDSVYWRVLDGIETRMASAAAVMLPALRQSLNSFTRRADIIMRQLTYSGAGVQNRLNVICARLKAGDEELQARALSRAGDALASLQIGFIDAGAMRLRAGRVVREVNAALEEQGQHDSETRKSMFLQSAIDRAFAFNAHAQRDYVMAAFAQGKPVRSQDLPVNDARELLMMAHAIELGAQSGSEFCFTVSATGQTVSNAFFSAMDEFTIELTEKHCDAG